MRVYSQEWLEGKTEGYQLGLQKGSRGGRFNGVLKVAEAMVRHDMDVDFIARLTDLSSDFIKQLKKGTQ